MEMPKISSLQAKFWKSQVKPCQFNQKINFLLCETSIVTPAYSDSMDLVQISHIKSRIWKHYTHPESYLETYRKNSLEKKTVLNY